MQVVVQSLLTHYEITGKGKVLLLLHGWGDNLNTYDKLTIELANNYQIIRLDLPGFGQTEAPPIAWKLDNYAGFVKDFLLKLGVHEIFAIVGHSNGGALAIRAVASGNLKAEKLVLLAASGVRNTARLKKGLTKAVAKTGKVATFWLPKTTRQGLQKKFYGTIGSDFLAAPHMQETFKLTVRQDIQHDATKITIPTLLIYGDKDKATPVESVGRRLSSKIAGSHIKVIPSADHFVHQVAANEVAKDIQEFLI